MSAHELFKEALDRAQNPSNPPSATLPAQDRFPIFHNGEQTDYFARVKSSMGSTIDFLPGPPPNSPHDPVEEHWTDTTAQNDAADSGPCRNFIDPLLSEQMPYSQALRDQGSALTERMSNFNIPGLDGAPELPQSRTSDIDALFLDGDDIEVPAFEELESGWQIEGSDRNEDITEMATGLQGPALEQHGDFMLPTGLEAGTSEDRDGTSHHTTQDLYLMSGALATNTGRTFSPTESELVAKGFEFHNELPEDVQIEHFGDKAFRKALREVNPELPRKQQWYAWDRVRQILENNMNPVQSFLENETDTQQYPTEVPISEDWATAGKIGLETQNTLDAHKISSRPVPRPILAPSLQISGNPSASEQWSTQVQPPSPTWSFSRISDDAFTRRNQAILEAGEEPGEPVQARHPSSVPFDYAEAETAAQSPEQDSPYMPPPRHGSPPDPPMSDAPSSPIPPPPRTSQPSPIQRPDTPRPIDASIRQSVEPETPRHLLHRDSTPAFEARSPTPSPASHIELPDIEMSEATPPAPTPGPALPLPTSSPDPISSPILTVTAPETPAAQSSPLKLPPHSYPHVARSPVPMPSTESSPLKPGKQRNNNRRKSTGVQGSKVGKSRNVTQKLTNSARKVTEKLKKEVNKVKQAVEKIEDNVRKQSQEKGKVQLTPTRRSSRIRSMNKGAAG